MRKDFFDRHYVLENKPNRCPFCGLSKFHDLLNMGHKEGIVNTAISCENCHSIIVVPLPNQGRLKRFVKYLKIAWYDSQAKPDNYYKLTTGGKYGRPMESQ